MATDLASLEVFRHVEYRPFVNRGSEVLLSTYPYMDVVLHDHCDARCKFCVGRLVHERARLPLDRATVQKVDFAVNVMGVREVLLLGGEPTLSPSLFGAIDILRSKNLNKICMTTNGHRFVREPEYAERVCRSGITHLNLSLTTFDRENQLDIAGSDVYFGKDDLRRLYWLCQENDVVLRINSNVFAGLHNMAHEIVEFYDEVRDSCDNVKFSSLLKTDSFSTVDEVTEFNRTHTLPDATYDGLFGEVERAHGGWPLVVNERTLGFVKNTAILMPTPLILNYNHSGRLRQMFMEERKVHGVKLLPTGDLSYSWNREERDLFIET
jgi:organic radical activating enzyme